MHLQLIAASGRSPLDRTLHGLPGDLHEPGAALAVAGLGGRNLCHHGLGPRRQWRRHEHQHHGTSAAALHGASAEHVLLRRNSFCKSSWDFWWERFRNGTWLPDFASSAWCMRWRLLRQCGRWLRPRLCLNLRPWREGRFQISDFRFQISDFRFARLSQTFEDFGFWIFSYQFLVPGSQRKLGLCWVNLKSQIYNPKSAVFFPVPGGSYVIQP